jgi:toxin HigB-1
MFVKFNNAYLKRLYEEEHLKGKPVYSTEVVEKYRERILLLEQVESTKELRNYKSLHFEALKGNKKGLYSIRINKQYRLEFEIEKDVLTLLEVVLIDELSKHYE